MMLKDKFYNLPQSLRFLFAGGINTIFSWAVFAMLYMLFGENIHYLLLVIITHIIGVTQAYAILCLLVFKRPKKLISGYFKCHIGYILSLIIQMVTVFILVNYLTLYPPLANVFGSCCAFAINYIVQKNLVFKPNNN